MAHLLLGQKRRNILYFQIFKDFSRLPLLRYLFLLVLLALSNPAYGRIGSRYCDATTVNNCSIPRIQHHYSSDGTCVHSSTGTCNYRCSFISARSGDPNNGWKVRKVRNNCTSIQRFSCSALTTNNCSLPGATSLTAPATYTGTCASGYGGSCRYTCNRNTGWVRSTNTCSVVYTNSSSNCPTKHGPLWFAHWRSFGPAWLCLKR